MLVDPNVPVDYGFIAMEKADTTIKDLIIKKAWHPFDTWTKDGHTIVHRHERVGDPSYFQFIDGDSYWEGLDGNESLLVNLEHVFDKWKRGLLKKRYQ